MRVPPAVYVLGSSVFVLGTTEFMIAGLLPEIATDLDVTIPQAGLLISAFAIGMTIGAPVMAVATLRLPRKATLLAASAVFLAGHVLAALAPSYELLMVARVVSAVATGAFWAVAAVVAVRLSPADATARALAVLVGGLTLANVLGVPAGTWVGQQLGWRAAFWSVAALSVVTAAAVAALVPRAAGASTAPPRVRDEVRVFRGRRIWLALATTAAFQAAMFAAFSYFAPLLTDVAGLDEADVPLVLALFGVGSFLGITVGGRIADRGLFLNIVGSLVALAVTMTVLALVSGSTAGAIAAVFAVGVAGFSIAPGLNARVFVVAGDAPTLASSVNTSAFNVGNTLGPWLGGAAISAGWGYVAPVWLAAGLALVALGVAVAAWDQERRHERALVAVGRPALATCDA
ncbi:Cmx/CmrA family chloramphenicol efflux MFS transporter [Jiangella alba]|uniref:MFS transporter, DHA1 family, chloramphenicol resistance protein n=1 Tax=Jiangella alba TaxID=561176 RepID=A0A1H5JUB4_9ACTN|nr:Cmx/CmrA family chloramphenicol efflux MFS transporter [Jiangella alba]SEE56024.1 MFS transporter, DHA1 family, chloramphenicol resistance protein [Jiangella alba]